MYHNCCFFFYIYPLKGYIYSSLFIEFDESNYMISVLKMPYLALLIYKVTFLGHFSFVFYVCSELSYFLCFNVVSANLESILTHLMSFKLQYFTLQCPSLRQKIREGLFDTVLYHCWRGLHLVMNVINGLGPNKMIHQPFNRSYCWFCLASCHWPNSESQIKKCSIYIYIYI